MKERSAPRKGHLLVGVEIEKALLESSSLLEDRPVSYLNFIIGAATFDHSGLPKEYYVTADSHDVSWVQTIFQGLGLQALLTVSLNLQGSQHIVIQSKEYRAIVIRQRVLYLALLIGPSEVPLSQEFVRWAEALDPRTLKNHERFSVA